jgi:heterotetrameric sarcosine oxidase gamma subunit
MAERHSALAGIHASADAASGATLKERSAGSLVQVAAWPGALPRVEALLSELTGMPAPGLSSAAIGEGVVVAATGPGRFMLAAQAEDLAPRFAAGLPSEDGAATDLSHGRVVLSLSGPAAAEILSRCVAIDLDPAVFPPGRAAQTMVHHIDVLIVRRGPTDFDIWALRSFAHALAEWILDTGRELGIGFERAAA